MNDCESCRPPGCELSLPQERTMTAPPTLRPAPSSGGDHLLDADVIIVGGGLAGYAALDELNLHGLSVILLEEKPRVGGNARTYVAPDGQLHPGGSTVLGVDGNGVLIGFLE